MAKDVITAKLDTINMVTAGSLKAVAGSKLKFEPLIHTSKQAGLLPAARFAMLSDPASLRDGFKPSGEFVVAARVSGDATSAFAAGAPAGVVAAAGDLKASAKPINVVIVADTDMLGDYTWVQTRQFFGQMIAQPFADNGDLALNAVDNLAGSADLINIRGRGAFSRPFDRVEALRRNADAQFRAKEQELEQRLQETEEQLSKLQTAQPNGSDAILSSGAAEAIEDFQKRKLEIRKDLRKVKADLNDDIKWLGTKLKLVNILIVPVVFTLLALLVNAWHKRRRHAIAMLRKTQVQS
jgi:ABC-type uncharacterized transport system involved in gliding motility auxiliary subunit